MTINHTPGPWVIGKQDHDVVMVDTTSGTAICDVYGDSDDRPANANLIAKNYPRRGSSGMLPAMGC